MYRLQGSIYFKDTSFYIETHICVKALSHTSVLPRRYGLGDGDNNYDNLDARGMTIAIWRVPVN